MIDSIDFETGLAPQKSDEYVTEKVRQMVASGEFDPSERLTETLLSKKLNLSRTPVRAALKVLAAEGVLIKRNGRGYQVRSFSKKDNIDAMSVRSVLEAQAAKELAMKGLSREVEDRFDKSLSMSEAVINRGLIDAEALKAFSLSNTIFHLTIIQASENVFLEDCLARLSVLPGAETGAVHTAGDVSWSLARLVVSHDQHVILKSAMAQGQASRAFFLMQEHVSASFEYHDLFARGVSGVQ
jgi:GntR family transcriptional regulator, vanillate catabolism transcriptional regulator